MKSLSDRMKEYEDAYRIYMTRRLPIIIRIDGRAFHTFTKGLDRPWDEEFMQRMMQTAQGLCEEITGAKLAYWQSDEISILVTDYDTLTTDSWFGKNLQKITSVSASLATAYFNQYGSANFREKIRGKVATFDSRAFVLPESEVCNYFLSRQRDAENNSIQVLGQSQFSQKQLHKINTNQIQEKLFTEKGINWNKCQTWQKRGACVVKDGQVWIQDFAIPIFSKDRDYVNKWVHFDEDETKEKTTKND